MSTPATLSPELRQEILNVWIAERRAMMERDGGIVRAGPGCTIEIQLTRRTGHVFQRINSPDGTPHFGTDERRDEIVRRLNGERAAPAELRVES